MAAYTDSRISERDWKRAERVSTQVAARMGVKASGQIEMSPCSGEYIDPFLIEEALDGGYFEMEYVFKRGQGTRIKIRT